MTAAANRHKGVLQERKTVVLHASWTPYVILWGGLMVVGAPFLILGLLGQQDGWIAAGIAALVGLAGTISLTRLQLTLSCDTVSYRNVLRTVRIPLIHVTAIHGAFGRDKGPIFALLVEVIPAARSRQICVNMKLFSKHDLRHLLDTAEVLGIHVHLDAMIATRLDRMKTRSNR
jgi:hypothetical protein